MTADYKILCDIGKEPIFSIGGESEAVAWEDLDKEENLKRIYRIQFNQAPHNGQLERVTRIIKQRPEIELRFYGDFSEELIDWDKLTDIRDLQIDLWNTMNLRQISKLTNLKRLGITKNVKSNVSLSIIEPLQNLEKFYTSVSKDIEAIGKLKRLQFVSLTEIKHDNLDFLTTVDQLSYLRLSFGSYNDFYGLSKIRNLQKLWVQQVRGFNNVTVNSVLINCDQLLALKLDFLKHITSLDFVPQMSRLRYLAFEGIKNIESYAPIGKSQSLEFIAGYACRPLDKSLGGLRRLKGIWLGDAYTKKEIENLLTDNMAENIWIRGKSLKGGDSLNNPFDLE